MGERAASTGTMPVFLVRFGYHDVSDLDPLSVSTPSLHPAFAFGDEDQLATSVRMPVIPYGRLETNNRH